MKTAAIACFLLILAAPLLSVTPPATAQSAPAWWDPPQLGVRGPDDFRKGWNLRVPVEVRNEFDYPVGVDHPIVVHLQMNRLAAEAGWIQSRVGGLPVARSFTLDPASVRLIEYGPNWVGSGSFLVELPMTVYEAWLEPDQTDRFGQVQVQPFDKVANPFVTLLWLPRAPIPPGRSAYYYVYFDVEENSVKLPATLAAQDVERLGGVYWVGRGTELWGAVAGSPTRNLEITASVDETEVTVYEYKPGFPKPTVRDLGSQPNPFNLAAAGDRVTLFPVGQDTLVKIVADKPVIAHQMLGDAITDFVPSFDRGLIGTRFHFTAPRQFDAFLLAYVDGASVHVTGSEGSSADLDIGGEEGFAEARFDSGVTYDIVASNPIAIQPRPALPSGTDQAHLVQVPSLQTGAPLGRWFYASTVPFVRGGLFRFLALDERSHPQLLPLPLGTPRLYPASGAALVRLDPGFENRTDLISQVQIPFFDAENPEYSQPHFAWSNDESDLPADEKGRFAYWAGRGSPTTAFGGDGARHFLTFGNAAVFAHYDATTVRIGVCRTPPDAGDAVLLKKDGAVRLTGGTCGGLATVPREIVSDKPITVMPLTAGSGSATYDRYLAGRLPPPRALVGTPEFRGFLVRVSSPDGAEPVFVTARPGTELALPIKVENLGRWSGGLSVTDTVRLRAVAPAEFGGDLHWEGSSGDSVDVPLAGGAAQIVPLHLTVPASTPPGTSLLMSVQAASGKNPSMTDALQVLLFVDQEFGARLYWESGTATNVKELVRELPVQTTILVPFILENAGTGTDSFRLASTPASLGWTVRVLSSPNGPTEVARMDNLQPGEKRRLYVQVTSPERADRDTFTPFVLQATSVAAPSAGDLIQGLFRLNLRRELRLDATSARLEIAPGGLGVFRLVLSNPGEAALTVALRVPTPPPTGWTREFSGVPQEGGTAEVSLTPGQQFPFDLQVRAPPGARAGEFVPLLVEAATTGRDTPARDAVGLIAVVGRVVNFTVQAPASLNAPPSGRINLTVQVNHTGNAPAEFILAPVSLPAGWLPGPVPTLRLGAPDRADSFVSGPLTLNVTLPASTIAGTYPIGLRVASRDGAIRLLTIQVVVAQAAQQIVRVDEGPHPIGPLDAATLPVVLSNLGNTPLTFLLSTEAAPDWTARTTPASLTVEPGRNGTVLLQVQSPRVASDALHTVRLRVAVRETQNVLTRDVQFHAQLPDVSVLGVSPLSGRLQAQGDILFLSALVANRAAVAAIDVPIALLVDGERVDQVRLERLGPNSTTFVTLQMVWPGSVPTIVVAANPDGSSPESDYANDRFEVVGTGLAESTPGRAPAAGLAILLAAVAVGLWGRRRDP